MPRPEGTTHAQTIFLRALRTPGGAKPDDWPAPAILRKWLRKPAFKAALQTVQDALHFQSDFNLASAANKAASTFLTQDSALSTQDSSKIIRLNHLRQRFPTTPSDDLPLEEPDQCTDRQLKWTESMERIAYLQQRTKNLAADYLDPKEVQTQIQNLQEQLQKTQQRLTKERSKPAPDYEANFERIAFERHYSKPLHKLGPFPDPVPQDTFYYSLIQDPSALLWYMQLYDQAGNDHRFQPILLNCKHLIPNEYPHKPLPRFQSQSTPTPSTNHTTKEQHALH